MKTKLNVIMVMVTFVTLCIDRIINLIHRNTIGGIFSSVIWQLKIDVYMNKLQKKMICQQRSSLMGRNIAPF